jgi:DNA repair protein RecN (Recombination protein N)
MLSQLHIENVAVIERADLELGRGLNILTGETGAGKSILIDSINFVLGERTSRDIVRTDARSANVTALFTSVSDDVKSLIEGAGYSCDDDGSLLVSRDLGSDGHGACRISGRPATVSILRDIGRALVNIHGQHDNQALMSPEKHIFYLDRYASVSELLGEYEAAYKELRAIERELKSTQTDAAEKARRTDLLNYQINEIDSADPQAGEDDELMAQRARLQNADKISGAINAACLLLGGADDERGAQELIGEASEQIASVTDVYPDISPLSERLQSLSLELDDCVSELHRYVDDAEDEGGNIEEIEQRLDTLYRLKMKYGGSIENVLEYRQNAQNELDGIENSDERAKVLRADLEKSSAKAHALAAKLTAERKAAAKEMSQKIKKELDFLEMPGVDFEAEVTPLGELAANGADRVEFLISANPGSPLRPLAKIASGGEISRIMLGIKTVLAGNDDIDTLIFDEIDSGVSGKAAQKIGLKLREVSGTRQVICVTHLAQIAAQADRHVLIEKNVIGGKTYTSLKQLDYTGRAHELARIMAGAKITKLTIDNAEELLDGAGVKKE